MQKNRLTSPKNRYGFTLIELMVALGISSIVVALVYTFFTTQNHAYFVQDQVLEMDQNSRAAMDMMRREIRMAGYNAMGEQLINNISTFVPSSFIPTHPLTVNLDANPKITLGVGNEPDMITFLAVLTSDNNPTSFGAAAAAGATEITLALNATQTGDQYNIGDIIHIGATSEYAVVRAVDTTNHKLTIDTNPNVTGNQGLAQAYELVGGIGYGIAEISVVSYTVFNDLNDSAYAYHTAGHPVLKRNVNNGGFQPVAENVEDMQISETYSGLAAGEIQLDLKFRTDKPDHEYSTNSGYRTVDTSTRIKIRNVDDISTGSSCSLPAAPANLVLSGRNTTYPCKIHITWNPVTITESGCEVTDYIVYYDDHPGGYGNSITLTDETTTSYDLDLSGLNACTYYVSVAAVNAGGIGPKAAEANISDSVAPNQPTGFTAVNVSGVERQVTLSWDENSDCDINGYYVYRSASSTGTFVQLNQQLISKEITNYTDTNFTPIDCNTYYYKVAAADFCLNLRDSTVVEVSPTAPAPPTNPGISGATITWTISADDVNVDGQNYVTGYKVYVYDSDDTLLTTNLLSAGVNETTCTEDGASYYKISTVGYCGGLESTPVQINAFCSQAPDIQITSPVSGTTTVSGTATVSATVTPSPSSGEDARQINSVVIRIDDDNWIDLVLDNNTWSYDWDTTKYAYGKHTITLKATDNVGCYKYRSMDLNVDNTGGLGLFCKIYACKASGNEYIYMAVYVHDQDGEAVSGATVKASHLFGSGSGSYTISETGTAGYYGGTSTPPSGCGWLTTDAGESISGAGLSIPSKGKYKDDEIPVISIIELSKDGYVSSSFCSWGASAQ